MLNIYNICVKDFFRYGIDDNGIYFDRVLDGTARLSNLINNERQRILSVGRD